MAQSRGPTAASLTTARSFQPCAAERPLPGLGRIRSQSSRLHGLALTISFRIGNLQNELRQAMRALPAIADGSWPDGPRLCPKGKTSWLGASFGDLPRRAKKP